jgi:hypothetical protein
MALLAAAAFLAACNADNSDAEEAAILDSAPRYGVSIITEKEDAGSMIAVSNTDGVVTTSPAGKVKAGATVTLSVRPELIATLSDDGGETGEGATEYWFVKSISGAYSMEGGPERTNVSFRPSPSVTNEWTFRMTPGDLTITVDFTQDPDQKTAALGGLYVNAGDISPGFTKDKYDYTITVPFDTTEFSISAQAENPYLTPVMLPDGGGGDSLLDLDLMSVENGGPVSEGLHRYVISVTSGDGQASATYNITVVQLPDLSLKEFKVKQADKDFERDLAPIGTQDAYIPYAEGITVVAEANDSGADININPSGSISGLLVNSAKTVSVTVSKTISNVEASLTSKTYVLNLYYGEGMASDPLAEGGYVNFIPGEAEGFYYEVHTFKGSASLSFKDGRESIVADVLLVAGGGGAGSACNKIGNDRGGGGGAGGLLYQTGQTLELTGGSIAVEVGKGGAGGVAPTQGTNGGDSSIGDIRVPGGGGGGIGISDSSNAMANGKNGGSGGGSGALGGNYFGSPGNANGGDGILGHNGGAGGPNSGGGGGGAAGPGGTVTNANIAGAGGAGWKPSGESAWIVQVTGTEEFSHGGRGGSYPAAAEGQPGANYGDGGSGRNGKGAAGMAGHDGIVIVRFQRTVDPVEVESQGQD